jgi:hypothetical protein
LEELDDGINLKVTNFGQNELECGGEEWGYWRKSSFPKQVKVADNEGMGMCLLFSPHRLV